MTRGGKEFYMTSIDDYSRFTRVYLFINKDKAFDMFLSYKAEIENQLNRTLKEMMNSLLVSASTANNLWGEAILSTYHLQNRISYKKTGKTPYELWKGHASNLKYLKVRGVLLRLCSKTSDCMFIGYASNSATYRFIVLKSGVLECNIIIETKNADFS